MEKQEIGFVFDVGSVYSYLTRLTDKRKRRGIRYQLETILVLLILAKFCGQDKPYGIAEWVNHRKALLQELLLIERATMPHHSTYRRVLSESIDEDEFEQIMSEYWQQQPREGQEIILVIDGKTLRGTISSTDQFGLHLLAAYLPHEGIVLMQMVVEKNKENEITVAPKLLKSVDLRNTIVLGDAMHTQRALSCQIVEAGGEYVWVVKDNQPATRAAIEMLFAPERPMKGGGCPPMDFRSATTVDNNHGRLEERTITVSSELNEYLDWPDLSQVFKLERRFTSSDGKVYHKISYGVTSLTAAEASPERLLEIVRTEWGIENGLHYRRDVTLLEDNTRMTNKKMARAMATINNLVLGIFAKQGYDNIPKARRFYDANFDQALSLLC
jgi:predicted transposase YbfD/YdcC